MLFLHDLTRMAEDGYRSADPDIATRCWRKAAQSVPVLHVWNKADAAPR